MTVSRWRLDGVRWGCEMLPEAERAALSTAIAVVDDALAGKRRDPIDPELDVAVARIAAVTARHRPRF